MMRSWIRILIVTAGPACGGGSESTVGPDAGPVAVVERRVDPGVTGVGITSTTGHHVVFAPRRSNRTNDLLVFLPGTGGRPDFYTRILEHAAERGHHAIGLGYPNAEAVNDLCAGTTSATCHEDVRVEVITGASRSPLVSVDVANSIDNRLRALLSWLDRNDATEGWSAFLSNGEPRWDRVIVAGHSQGGGHAGMIARLRVVRRGILFAATEPAPWTSAPFATSPNLLYGFVHRLEPSYAGLTASWRLMGMVGPITRVDGASPPFAGSHQLETNIAGCREVAGLSAPHSCVVVDAITPLGVDGRPLLAPVWTYLLEG